MRAAVVPDSLTRSAEDYLKAIYQLSPEGRPASTSEIASLLAVSETMIERMATALGNPTVAPHGDPIPAADGSIHELASTALSDVPVSETVEIQRRHEGRPERPRYIASLGLRPGVQVKVINRGQRLPHRGGVQSGERVVQHISTFDRFVGLNGWLLFGAFRERLAW